MMRALWTGASGMISQQTYIDTISNNLSNVNTTGYKKEQAEFKTLLYETIQDRSTDAQGNVKPVGIQVGLGVYNSAVVSQYTQGGINETGGLFDFAIQGNGFFQVRMPDGSTAYTRNGAFTGAIGTDGLSISTSDGFPLLDTTGNSIVIDPKLNIADLSVDTEGNLLYPDASGNDKPIGVQIELAQFSNPAGLAKTYSSLLVETEASGSPRLETADTNVTKSIIKKGYLENSNVQAIDEMVNLIVAQRAYQMNSKIITAADEMLQQANSIRQ